MPIQDYELRIGGVPVDLWHTTHADEEALIDTVLHEHSLDQIDLLRTAADHDSIRGKAAIRIWAPDKRYPVSYFQIG